MNAINSIRGIYKTLSFSKILSVALMALLVLSTLTGFLAVGDKIIDEEMTGSFEEEDTKAKSDEGELQSIVIQPGEEDGKDTFILNRTKGANFGAYSQLWVGNQDGDEWRSLLQFDIPGYVGKLQHATLKLYTDDIYGEPDVSVHALSSGWVEGTGDDPSDPPMMAANWTHRTDDLTWDTQGGDYYDTPYSYRRCTQTDIWYSWNVTDIVDLWISGNRENHGFILKPNEWDPSVPAISAGFHSSESAEESLRPRLILSYAARIDPPVPDQVMDENDPMRTISLRDREHETIESISDIGNTASLYPFYGSNENECRMQNVFTPEMVGTDGVINRISFGRSLPLDVATYNNLRIYLGHTELDELTTTFANNYHGNLVEVFSADNYEFNSSDGDPWIHFDLNNSFWYDSSYNLLLELTWEGSDGSNVRLEAHQHIGKVIKIMSWDLTSPTGFTSAYLQITRFETELVDEFTSISGPITGGNNAIPFLGGSADVMHFQTIYTPDQVGAEGHITRLSFQRRYSSDYGNFSDFSISFAHTEINMITDTFADNYHGFLIEVFPKQEVDWDASYDDIWIHFDLNDNFTYDNSYNLLIDITWEGDGGRNIFLKTTQYSHAMRLFNSDDIDAPTGSTANIQPVAKFETDIIQNAVVDKGENSNYWPFASGNEDEMRLQMLYNHTLLGETGIMDKIHFQAAQTSPDWGTFENLSIRVAHSEFDDLTLNLDDHNKEPWTEVFNRSSYNVSTVGRPEWIEFDIDNIFTYNGLDNLVIDIRWLGKEIGSDLQGVNLLVNTSVTYFARAGVTDYSSSTADFRSYHLYNLQVTFLRERNYSWSASSSDTSLFTTSTTGNWLDGWDLHITPRPDAFGEGWLTLRLHNSNGRTAVQRIRVTINPVNKPPELTGVPTEIQCIGGDDHVLDMEPYAYDRYYPDDLTFDTNSSYTSVDGSEITFNYPDTVFFEFVKITVEDPEGLSDYSVLQVTVIHRPVLTGPETFNCPADVDRILDMTPYTSDPDNELDELTFSTDSSHASVNGHLITFNYPDTVEYELVNITVTDPDGLTDYTMVNVSVTQNQPPLLSGVPSEIEVIEFENYTLDMSLYASDPDHSLEELTFYTDSDFATVDGTLIVFNYHGVAEELVNITVEDPGGLKDHALVHVTVVLVLEYPEVVSHSPTGNDVSPRENIVVEFSMSMDTDSVEDAFSLTRGATNIAGSFIWDEDNQTMTFDPNNELQPGDYTATIDTRAMSTENTTLISVYTWTFSVPSDDPVDDPEFVLDPEYEDELEEGPVSDKLRDAFEDAGYPLSEDAELEEEDGVWYIVEDGQRKYRIEIHDDGLYIYEEDDVIDDDETEGVFPLMWLLLILVAVIVVIALVLVMKKRGPKEAPSQQPPMQEQQYQPPPQETYDETPPPAPEEDFVGENDMIPPE